jgi:hypothetical protein
MIIYTLPKKKKKNKAHALGTGTPVRIGRFFPSNHINNISIDVITPVRLAHLFPLINGMAFGSVLLLFLIYAEFFDDSWPMFLLTKLGEVALRYVRWVRPYWDSFFTVF